MTVAKDIQGTVFQNATATFMARVESSAGVNLDQAAVASIKYTISEISQADPRAQRAVIGHENTLLDKTAVIYDVLQNDATWTVDAIGYNFRHEIDVSQHEAFPQRGEVYQVRYEIVPAVGQKIVFRFCVRCI